MFTWCKLTIKMAKKFKRILRSYNFRAHTKKWSDQISVRLLSSASNRCKYGRLKRSSWLATKMVSQLEPVAASWVVDALIMCCDGPRRWVTYVSFTSLHRPSSCLHLPVFSWRCAPCDVYPLFSRSLIALFLNLLPGKRHDGLTELTSALGLWSASCGE